MLFNKDNIIRLSKPLGIVFAAIIILCGIIVIAGWYLDIGWMKQLGNREIAMKPNLAFSFIFYGVCLILLWDPKPSKRKYILILIAVPVLTGLITVAEYLTGNDLFIDRMLIPLIQGDHVVRMAFIAAINLVLTGLVFYLLLNDNERSKFAALVSIVIVFTTSIVGYFSYLVEIQELFLSPVFRGVAVAALIIYMLISVSLLMYFLHKNNFILIIEHQISILLTFIAVMILFLSINSRQRVILLREAGEMVEHTILINKNLTELLSLVVDNQSGSRGYLLNGNKRYLEPVHNSEKLIPELVSNLDSLISDNPAQLRRMGKLKELVQQRIELSRRLIDLKDNYNDSAYAIFNTSIGDILSDSIKNVINIMGKEEDSLLIRRNERELLHAGRTRSIVVFNTVIQFILLITVFWVVMRFIKLRRQKINEIEQENISLENKVIEHSDSISKIENRFRTTLESLLEGCQIIDFNYRYLFVNDTAARQAKVDRKKLEGRLMTGLFPGIESTEMFRSLKRSMTERIVCEMDNQFYYRDGSCSWFRLKMIPLQEGVLIMSSDITFLKKAVDELRNSNEKYRYLFDNNPLPMWIYDLQTTQFLEVNEAAIIKYGYSKEEFLNMTLNDIRPQEDVSLLMDNIKQTIDTLAASGPWRHLKKDGEIIFVEISSHTIQLEGRDARLVLSNDVTEKVKALEKIVESERIYKYVFEHNPQPMWIFDTETYAFLQVNQAAIEHYGYTREEFLNMTSKDIRPPEDVATLVSTVSNEKNEISNTGYWRHIKKNGEIIYVEILTHSIVFEDHKARLVLSYDITRRLKAEESLNRKNQALEMALRQSSSGSSAGNRNKD